MKVKDVSAKAVIGKPPPGAYKSAMHAAVAQSP